MRLLFSICILIITMSLSAQETEGEVVTIEQKNGQLLVGTIVKITADEITVSIDQLGNQTFNKKDITKLHKGIKNTSIITNTSEPYYFPTARTNGKGNHYYKNYFLFGNNFDFGITDYINLSFGFELASILLNSNNGIPIMQLGTKIQIPITDNFNMGFYSRIAFNDEGSVLLAGIPITIGSKRTNISFTPTLFRDNDFEENYMGLAMAGSLALTDKIRLVSDVIIIEEGIINTTLVEFTFKNGFSILPGVAVSNDFSIVPNFALTIPFGNWK